MSLIVGQFQTIRFIQIMSLTFDLFTGTQVSDSGPLGALVMIVGCYLEHEELQAICQKSFNK